MVAHKNHRIGRITAGIATAFVSGLLLVAAPSAASAAPSASPSAQSPARAGLPRFGQSGDAVRALQQALVAKGFTLVGGIDGIFSPRTRATLRNFQSVVGFKATGILDRKTARVLGLTASPVAPTTTVAVTAPPATVAPTTTVAPAPVAASAAAPAPITWSVGMFPVMGARGDAVTALQNALISSGVEVFGGADGIFGNATRSALLKLQAARNIPRSGVLDEATAIELGLLPRPVLATTIAVFPVRPACYFTDTWMAPRGTDRKHEGVDIIANRGQEVLAVADGTITKVYTVDTAKLSGNAVRLTTADGTYFFYAHLDTFAPGIAIGTKVAAGQVIGTVGSTGATTPHLHFEVHPLGGAAVNPYPIVKAVDACRR